MTRQLLLAWLLVFPCGAGLRAAGEGKKVDFSHEVLPLLKARCAGCHTAGKYKGGVSMDTRADILKSKAAAAGNSAASKMILRVSSKDPDERMPPKGPALTAKEVQALRGWIDEGLAWPAGFSFKGDGYLAPLKPRVVVLPPARAGRTHPIDRILDDYFARNKVKPPAALDDRAFLRRVYLDLIGLLPTPAEQDAYLADTTVDRRTRLVRKLLDERRGVAEHWLTFWNDLLRNDYAGTGYIDGGRKQISGWLYRSLLDNKPYDQFARELIAPKPESEGFLHGIKWRGAVNASQVVELQMAQNVAQVFFGVNLKCASCHDSFIDGWKLDDAYGLAAVVADRPLEVHRCDKPQGRKASPRFLFAELGTIDAALPRAKRLERLAELVTHRDNGRFTRTIANRLWQRLMGRGIVHPVDAMAGRPWSENLLDHLANELAGGKYDLKRLLEHIVTSNAYQSQAVMLAEEQPAEAYVFRGPEVKRLTAEQFLDAVWQITGQAPGKPAGGLSPPAFAQTVPEARRFVRASLVPCDALMRSLGRPNREQVVTTRPDQLTTLQALDLANGQQLTDTLARGAAAILKAHPKERAAEYVRRVYRQALCREGTADELRLAGGLLKAPVAAGDLADLLWVVFMLPEFQLVR